MVIPRMIECNVYYQLAEISPLDYGLFKPLTGYFKKLIFYAINEHNIPPIYELAEILGRYLYGFTKYNSLVGYQQVYLNRLVSDILKILNKYPEFVQIWLLSEHESNFAQFVSKIPQNGRLPLFLIIKNFLVYDEAGEFNQEEHIVELFKLTRRSLSFSDWCQDSCNIMPVIIDTCVPIVNQISFRHNEEFAKYFRIFCSIVESSNPKTGNLYYSLYEQQVINIILVNETCDYLTFSILEQIIRSPTIDVLEKLFANTYMLAWVKDRLHDQEVLDVLTLLFRRHDKVLIRMLSNNKKSKFAPYSVTELGTQVMRITERDHTYISTIMAPTVRDMSEVTMFTFSTRTGISKVYLSLLLNYFQNQPTLNNFLNEFSSVVFLKLCFLNNQHARSIIEFLYNHYFEFLRLLQKHEKYKYDSLESRNLHVNNTFLQRRQKLLKELEGQISGAEVDGVDVTDSHESIVRAF
ncbi:hypothetical protein Cantr_07960 [Candida viswanathii]|uniref:Uncharacterized protein n=1 Tax=Candida viswanathii TaxID=5486 RepID=A0A367Y271_9ASCO|nr:hypothetical protein Cantr_07960 [Candida viswanathii]